MARQYISSGGTEQAGIVSSGGVVVVSTGASVVAEAVESGGTIVFAGGTLASGTVSAFTATALSSVSGAVIFTGGTEAIGNTTVTGTGSAVVGAGGYASSLTIAAGGVLTVSGGIAVSTVVSSGGSLVLGSGGILSGLTSSTGASVNLGGVYLSSGTTILGEGNTPSAVTVSSGWTEVVLPGGTAVSGIVNAGGTEIASSGGITSNTVIAGGTVELQSGSTAAGAINFQNLSGILQIDDTTAIPSLATIISGFTGHDAIDLAFLTSAAGANLSVSRDTVTLTTGGGAHYQFTIDGASSKSLTLGADATGHMTINAVCYYPGTLIRTRDGDRAVETLSIGDQVVTADGRALPVRWIGLNTVSTRFADPLRVLPIRIKAGALGENLPERDLLVSPEHALLIEDILIQAGALVNGLSILRETEVPEIFTYYHVECAEHVLILAEGTPAESFVDNVSRMSFDNWAEHEALYGDAPITEMPHPRAQSLRQVPQEIRDRLMARAVGLLPMLTQPAA